jgi:lipopolysaccharide transport system ATP-binding protein
MYSDFSIKIENLTKIYQIYAEPRDRLKQFIMPRLQKYLGLPSKQYYREFGAINDVSFEVKRGETVGIIGRNGSGKSTLLQMICGTLNPTNGTIHTNGRIAALLELGSGFNPEFSGRENVYMNASVLGLAKEEIELRFEAIVAFADIGDFLEQPVKTYSSGMMVRLAFAVIAHVDADILIIDEALAVGDAFFTQKCMRYLRTFMKTGTVLFVSHDTASVRNLCNKAIWIEKGSVLKQGSPKDVCEDYLEAFYEAQDGKSTTTRLKVEIKAQLNKVYKDQRQDFFNASNLRNDIELFSFDQDASSFGKGHAQISNVQFLNMQGDPLIWIVGGEEVVLRVEALAHSALDSPIIGFHIKDRLGQALFGDNTYLSYVESPIICQKGEYLSAEFHFLMPRLASGNYSVSVAIADGSQHDHVQHHWIHDALYFKSESTSVAAGLIGIPMSKIVMNSLR